MPIIKKNFRRPYHSAMPDDQWVEHETLFADRVVRVDTKPEYRNVSPTMDVSDWQTIQATRALVWLGTRGVPPRTGRSSVPTTDLRVSPYDADKVRDLDFHEQFAWVDCSNVFADLHAYHLTPAVDGPHGLFGDPLMWANLVAWEGYHKALAKAEAEEARKVTEECEAREVAEVAKKAAAQAKRDAKVTALKSGAEAQLARIPAKGTVVTVGDFTGRIFWSGVTKHNRTFSARAGIKNSKGEVLWVDASALP